MLALLVARDIADLGAPDFTLADLEEQWGSRDLDLGSDALIVEAGGEIVGYAIVHRPGSLAVVAPDHEGRGVGSTLLRWVERGNASRAARRTGNGPPPATPARAALLSAAGYTPRAQLPRMVRRLDDVGRAPPHRPASSWNAGRGDRRRRVHELDAESFAAAPDYVPESFEAFCEGHLQAHDTDPQLSRVAWDRRTVVGFLLARRWPNEGVGFMDILAVDPGHQRRGIGTALLRAAFAGILSGGAA